MDLDSWSAVKTLIETAKGGDARRDPGAVSLEQIARQARHLPSTRRDLDKEDIRYVLRCAGGGVFNRGQDVRSILAAVDVPLVEALEASQWWPDMRWSRGISPVERVAEGLRLMGIGAKLTTAGNRIVVDLTANT